jgi:hypothetical protein
MWYAGIFQDFNIPNNTLRHWEDLGFARTHTYSPKYLVMFLRKHIPKLERESIYMSHLCHKVLKTIASQSINSNLHGN